jgi:tRNA nucleotidyltransferase (CCA-adding enzyme)
MAGHDSQAGKKASAGYLTRLQCGNLEIRGPARVARGLRPGPLFKPVLDGVRRARLDGEVNNRREELELARRLALEYEDKAPERKSRSGKE